MGAARCFSREPLRVRTKVFIIVRMQILGSILFHIHVASFLSCFRVHESVYSVAADSNFHSD